MKKHLFLRELAKIGVGLVLADMLSVVFFSTAGFFPISILGVTWTSQMIPEIIVFDAAILILLVHFGWNMKLPIASPSERGLLYIVGTVFLAVGLLHLIRLTFNWSIIIGDFYVPNWISWLGVLLTAYLSYSSFHFASRRK